MAGSHRDLAVWQKAMSLVTDIYAETEQFPSRDMYGLTRQVLEAAVSVASNIAEGKGRLSKREYIQFLSRARGSLYEVETQLEIGSNLGYMSRDRFEAFREQCDEVGRLLNGLIKSIQQQLDKPSGAV